MGYLLNFDQGDQLLSALRKDFRVFAPKRFAKEGRYSDTDIIRYAEVEAFRDIVWDVKSDFPAKEVLSPIQQTLFYFTEDAFQTSKDPRSPSCFWRGRVISTPRRSRPGFTPATAPPPITTTSGCVSCTVACSTCTCFTTRDLIHGDNPDVGERRRVTDSCQIAGFDQMAGQREIRSTAGNRMRYKVFHKYYDYKARFGDSHMCVGCGRCIHRCPEFISIAATVDKMNAAVEEIKTNLAR